MYTDDFLLNCNCHISAQKKIWLKLAIPVKRAIFNLSKCQFSCIKITDKNYLSDLKKRHHAIQL